MKPRPFRLLGESELERIAAAAGGALERWRSAWLEPGAGGGVEARPAARAALGGVDPAPLVRCADDGRWVAVLAGQAVYRAAAARFAAQAGEAWSARGELTPVLRGAVEECFAALADEILAAARAQGRDARTGFGLDEAWQPGSGAAVVLANLEDEGFAAVLSAGVVSELLGRTRATPRGGLARRIDCIQDRRIGLRVLAGEADLAIGSLVSAAPGDVIVLDARIDQTFALTGAGGAPVGRGFLGSSAGSKALQIVS